MNEQGYGGSERPLTIAMVVDTSGNRGNGTSNSALQWADELQRQGHRVRLVGIGAPDFPARVNHVPLVSWVAKKQQMQFAEPSDTLFRAAFLGVDVVHLYTPFRFCQHACRMARQMGIPVTAGYHVQPENITYSAGPLKHVPGIDAIIYRLFDWWLFSKVDRIHVPTELGASLLRSHGYKTPITVISNGYEPRFTPKSQRAAGVPAPTPFHIVASGRLSNEKDQITLIRAAAMCRHASSIRLTIAGTGPLKRRLQRTADRLLPGQVEIGFHRNTEMPELLRSGDLFVHPSIADLESVSVIEGMASGLVPVIAASRLSAAGQFSLLDESLFPVGDVAALAQCIDWWIDRPGRAVRMGCAVRRTHQDALFGGGERPPVRGDGARGHRRTFRGSERIGPATESVTGPVPVRRSAAPRRSHGSVTAGRSARRPARRWWTRRCRCASPCACRRPSP